MIKLREIKLSVKRGKFRCDDPLTDESSLAFKKIRPSILKRDNNTCQFCGFASDKYQEVHHIDDNHANNDPSNLVTTCSLCHAAHHIGFSGIQNRGIMIYIDPSKNITQADINNVVRSLWVAESSKNKDINMSAIGMLSRLYKCSVSARRAIKTSDATVFGDFLLSLSDKDYKNRADKLKGVYFLPTKDQFHMQFKHWYNNNYKSVQAETWNEIAKMNCEKWTNNEHGHSSDAVIARDLGILTD